MTAAEKPLMQMAREERADLAAFLATLTREEWVAPSLCDGWSVKDVVAHVVSYEDLGAFGLIKRFLRGGIVRANGVGVKEFAPMSPQELLEFLKDHLEPRGLTAGFGGMIALVDGTIHHQTSGAHSAAPARYPSTGWNEFSLSSRAILGSALGDASAGCDFERPTSTGRTAADLK